MKTYNHSKAFETLKATQEEITSNLTSLQYLSTLDMFLWNALAPIHSECPSIFTRYLAQVTANQTLKASTRYSSDDRAKLPITLFNVITSPDPAKAHEVAKTMYLNRGLLFGFLSLFLNRMRRYEQLHSPVIPLNTVVRNSEIYRIERSVCLRPNGQLYAAIQQVRFWYDKARAFKGMIMQKYTRMALMNAQLAYKDYNHYVPLDDTVQIFNVVLSRAIDRCDARQGVLTTFIQNWFKSARGEVANQAKGQTDQSIESLNEDHGDSAADILGFTMPDTGSELIQHIAYVAKKIDVHGYIRATLGIPEFVTEKHKAILRQFVWE